MQFNYPEKIMKVSTYQYVQRSRRMFMATHQNKTAIPIHFVRIEVNAFESYSKLEIKLFSNLNHVYSFLQINQRVHVYLILNITG